MFGEDTDISETRNVILNSLKMSKDAMNWLLQSGDLLNLDTSKIDFLSLVKQALVNIEQLQHYSDAELEVSLNEFVGSYINLDSLKQDDGKL